MTYPSDISPQQFSRIEPLLDSVRKHTKPRTYQLLHIFNAVLYALRTGCQWRSLPKDYPDYRTVHKYFMMWSNQDKGESILEQVLKKIGRRNAYQRWKKWTDQFHNHRRTEREEY